MLIQFKVKNYTSFKEEVILDLIPSSDEAHQEFLSTINKNTALNCIAVYGANASGKSNLMKAVTASIMTVRESHSRQINEKLYRMIPFKFDNESVKEPCSFEYTIVTEGKKYIYGFSASQERIFEEYLYEYTSAKPSLIFELNKKSGKYRYPKAENKVLGPIVDRNPYNKLLLSSATNWNYERTKPVFTWFLSCVDTFDNLSNSMFEHFDRFSGNNNFEELKKFTLRLLKTADINIDDYEITNNRIILNQSNKAITGTGYAKQNISDPNTLEVFDVYTSHAVENKRNFKLNIREESLGTINVFGFAPVLEKAIKYGNIVFVDELEKSLHPYLSKLLIEYFKNTATNKKGAQLIFTTHSTNLLDLDLFRRDQIYFTEKNPKTAVSDLYSLNDFPVRKTENIEKGYLLGRYGAIPYIHPEDLNE